MNILLTSLLGLLLLQTTAVSGVKSEQLPEAINSALNRKFPGWRFSEVSGEVRQFFRERLPDARPSLIKGDFDDNGQTDYAVLIEHPNFDKRGQTFSHVVEKLAFLKKGAGYKLHLLEERAPANLELYLTLAGKGEEGRDFHTRRRFRYPNDSISVSYFGKAGGTFIFRQGRFRYVVESD